MRQCGASFSDKVHSIKIHDPLVPALLSEYERCWHAEAIPDLLDSRKVVAISMDGHMKVATRCHDAPPPRTGMPRQDGHIKSSYNRWFMVTDTPKCES